MSTEEKTDPWPVAQEAVFNMIRAWVDPQYGDARGIAQRCLDIVLEVNETEGAPFIFVCETARVFALYIARYITEDEEALPSREQILAEIDLLEWEYIEEAVLAESEEETDAPSDDNQPPEH